MAEDAEQPIDAASEEVVAEGEIERSVRAGATKI